MESSNTSVTSCFSLSSGRTPQAYYLDDSRQILPQGVMVMEFLEGNHLDYEKDLDAAAACLADVHSLPIPSGHSLIAAANPAQEMLSECLRMFAVYEAADLSARDYLVCHGLGTVSARKSTSQ